MPPRFLLLIILLELVYLTVGIICLIWPEKVQEFALSRGGVFFYHPLRAWVRKSPSLWSLRAVGLTAIVTGCFIAVLLLRRLTN